MVLSSTRRRGFTPATLLILLLQLVSTAAQENVTFNANSDSSIKAFTKLVADDIMSIYVGNEPGQTPGVLPGDGTTTGYYWWVGGGMFGTFINYWHHTGNTEWNDETKQAIIWQSAPSQGGYFESSNYSLQLGNDDISFWAFAALEAAEYGFPNPDPTQPQWLEMVQGVFNRQAGRWDNACGGGLRWQVFSTAPGYTYKNSISNGCFFNIAARLAKYTGNMTYATWAEKAYDWTASVKLIDDDYAVYDGLNVSTGCQIGDHIEQWTYNNGVFLYGSAIMWNITRKAVWRKRVLGFLNHAQTQFFKDDPAGNPVLTETLCEATDSCQVDGSTFKAYLARWMRATTTVANWTYDQVTDMLQYSAPAAAATCTDPGGDGGLACGQQWYTGSFDGRTGIGMNMNAMEIMQTLIPAFGPLTAKTGGHSKGNPSAGLGTPLDELPDGGILTVTTGDKAGAAILTILLVFATLGGAYWIVK